MSRSGLAFVALLILTNCSAHAQSGPAPVYVSPLEDRHGWGGKWMAHPGVPALDPITGKVRT